MKLHWWNADPVAWVPRELNKQADRICNLVMDSRKDFSFKDSRLADILYSGFNIKIGTDGGSRGAGISSTGWAVFAVQVGDNGEEGQNLPVIKGGTFYSYPMCSLAIEAKALVEALTVLDNYM